MCAVAIIVLCVCFLIGAFIEEFMESRSKNTQKTMKRMFKIKSRILWAITPCISPLFGGKNKYTCL